MKFCSNCAAPIARRVPPGDSLPRYLCDACGSIHYENPRLVVGTLPEWQGKVLLCRRAIEPRYGYWTLPAGFMENGETVDAAAARETLEEAVRREVREEAGIRCGRVRYLATQPWPFPSSLMLGFLTEALTEEITVDPKELAEARWFSRDEVREMVARAETGAATTLVLHERGQQRASASPRVCDRLGVRHAAGVHAATVQAGQHRGHRHTSRSGPYPASTGRRAQAGDGSPSRQHRGTCRQLG